MKTNRTIEKWAMGTFFVLLLGLSGCQSQSIQSGSAYPKTYPALIEIDEHLRLQRPDLAVEGARKEIRNPSYPSQYYKARTLQAGIIALVNLADNANNNFDLEILEYYNEATKLVGEDIVALSFINSNMGTYFIKTGHLSKSLAYSKKALDYASKSHSKFASLMANSRLSMIYGMMGEHRFRETHSEETLDIGKAYFFPFFRLPLGYDFFRVAQSDWMLYSEILMGEANRILDVYLETHDQQKALIAIDKVWGQLEEALNRSYGSAWSRYTVAYVNYLEIAKIFAHLGNISMARELYGRAGQVWEEDKYFWAKRDLGDQIIMAAETNFECFKGFIDQEEGTEKLDSFENCGHLWASKIQRKLPLGAIEPFGRVYEKNGQYLMAILRYSSGVDELESLRTNISVDERTRFFGRGLARTLHWGLIRTSTKYASITKKPEDLTAALKAVERFRSRQLWEKLGGAENLNVSDLRFEELPNKIKGDTIVLNYVLTDKWLIILAIIKGEVIPIVQKYDGREFADKVRSLAREMGGAVKFSHIQPKLIEVSDTLLGPVRPFMKSKPQIIVVPDGVMNLIPFDLLSLEKDAYIPLMKDKFVRTIPSLRALQIEGGDAVISDNDRIGLFAVGNPIYTGLSTTSAPTNDNLDTETAGNCRKNFLNPLPDTETEIHSIKALFDGEPKTLLGPDALESKVKSTPLDHYKYLHFSTHGILGENGLGEPALILGHEPGEDGCLKASEVAEELKNRADVTVLSACNTGGGEHVTGEGVMGMSRAFMLAGSRSVLVSLWKIESEETAKLMEKFYRYMMKSGMDPAKALTLVRRHEMDDPTTRTGAEAHDPMRYFYYWAGFVLIERSVGL